MNNNNKEYKIQKALGLAGEWIITITSKGSHYLNEVEDELRNNSFNCICTEIDAKYRGPSPYGWVEVRKYKIKCPNELVDRIFKKWYSHLLHFHTKIVS